MVRNSGKQVPTKPAHVSNKTLSLFCNPCLHLLYKNNEKELGEGPQKKTAEPMKSNKDMETGNPSKREFGVSLDITARIVCVILFVDHGEQP